MEIQELREVVNPVFNTAKSCVQLIAAAGDQDAQSLVGALGFGSIGAELEGNPEAERMKDQLRILFPAFTIVLESRYRIMNQLIESRKDRLIVDLPCGYTSRGIRMSRLGRGYFGFDLPAVIDDILPAVQSIIGKDKKIAYHAVDATNYHSLEAPFRESDRNFMITTEGLLMYFSQQELEEVFRNIHMLLQKHGGSWVISDRAIFLHDREVANAALNHDVRLTAIYEMISKKAAGQAADVAFNNNVFFDPDDGNVKAFIDRMGFELEEVPMGDYLPEQFSSVSGPADVEVRKALRGMYFWELTVKEQKKLHSAEETPFSVTAAMSGDQLHLGVTGRVDTLTAPEILKAFQAVQDEVGAIEIDASEMNYISSAGLRVLLIMYKSLKEKERFRINGMTEAVRKIFETTGFDQLM